MVSKVNQRPNLPRPANGPSGAKIIVLSENVAIATPPPENLTPLLEHYDYMIANPTFVIDQLHDEDRRELDLTAWTAFPPGLVARVQDALTAEGYQVGIDDRRAFNGEAFRIDLDFCRRSRGQARELLLAVTAQPLGQIEFEQWHDVAWRVAHVCDVFPQARTLIITDTNGAASGFYFEHLDQAFGNSVGLLARERINEKARCVVSSLSWLPRLRPDIWDVLLLVGHRSSVFSKATWRAVARLRAPRIYSLVNKRLRFGKATRLRMEALSGSRILSLSPV